MAENASGENSYGPGLTLNNLLDDDFAAPGIRTSLTQTHPLPETFPQYDQPLPRLNAAQIPPDVDLMLGAVRHFRSRSSPKLPEVQQKPQHESRIGTLLLAMLPKDVRQEIRYRADRINEAKAKYHQARAQYPKYPSIANRHLREAVSEVSDILYHATDRRLEALSTAEHRIRRTVRRPLAPVATALHRARGKSVGAANQLGERLGEAVQGELRQWGALASSAAGVLFEPFEAQPYQLASPSAILMSSPSSARAGGLPPFWLAHEQAPPFEITTAVMPTMPQQPPTGNTYTPKAPALWPQLPLRERVANAWRDSLASEVVDLMILGPPMWVVVAFGVTENIWHGAGARIKRLLPAKQPQRSTFGPGFMSSPHPRRSVQITQPLPVYRPAGSAQPSARQLRPAVMPAASLTYAAHTYRSTQPPVISRAIPPGRAARVYSGPKRTLASSWSRSTPAIQSEVHTSRLANQPHAEAGPSASSSAFRYNFRMPPGSHHQVTSSAGPRLFRRYAYLTDDMKIETLTLSGIGSTFDLAIQHWETAHPTNKLIDSGEM